LALNALSASIQAQIDGLDGRIGVLEGAAFQPQIDALDARITVLESGSPVSSVQLPAPPASYSLPQTYTLVTNTAEFEAAINSPVPNDIVLADGIYEGSSYWTIYHGHRIYAQNLGGAVLKSGMIWGTAGADATGALLQGPSFNVTDPAKEHPAWGLVHYWGQGSGLRLLDLAFEGNGVCQSPFMVRQAEDCQIQRIVSRNFQSYGCYVSSNNPANILSVPVIVEDIDAENINRTAPGSSNGTAEAGVWLGERCTARRLKTRNCAWMGVWSGNAIRDSLIQDVDVDSVVEGAGYYAEHKTIDTIFEKFRIGPASRTGIICEYGGPEHGFVGAADNLIIQDGFIDSWWGGVWFGDNTKDTTVRRVTFVNQSEFAINNHGGLGNLWDTQGNDYSGILPGAEAIQTTLAQVP
jgi:hypothetical protein